MSTNLHRKTDSVNIHQILVFREGRGKRLGLTHDKPVRKHGSGKLVREDPLISIIPNVATCSQENYGPHLFSTKTQTSVNI